MLTLNTRQLTSLAAVAPGTLLCTNDDFRGPIFLTTEDDRKRSGIWSISVDQKGDVTEYMAGGRTHYRSYEQIQEEQRGIAEEAGMVVDDA